MKKQSDDQIRILNIDKTQNDVMKVLSDSKLDVNDALGIILHVGLSIAHILNEESPFQVVMNELSEIKKWKEEDDEENRLEQYTVNHYKTHHS